VECPPGVKTKALFADTDSAHQGILGRVECGQEVTVLGSVVSGRLSYLHVLTDDGKAEGYLLVAASTQPQPRFERIEPTQSPVAPATGPTGGGTPPDRVYKPVGKLRPFGPAQAEASQNLVASQSKVIADLSQRVLELEGRIQGLEQRETERSSVIESPKAAKVDLSEVRLQLAGFNSACTSDQDRAVAMAIVENLSVHTYEGAAAMNCAGRLKRIVDDLVQSLARN